VEVVRLHLGHVSNHARPFDAPVHGFVLKHPRAGAILVDTGIGDPPAEIIRYWDVVNEQMAAALAEHDLSPADVRPERGLPPRALLRPAAGAGAGAA
jgi:glyoxylase-like metal-dependent hydrolase (beta-lactamase superfamily II)